MNKIVPDYKVYCLPVIYTLVVTLMCFVALKVDVSEALGSEQIKWSMGFFVLFAMIFALAISRKKAGGLKNGFWLLVPGICGVLMLVALTLFWNSSRTDNMELQKSNFSRFSIAAESLIGARMTAIEQAVLGISGLFTANDLVTSIQWEGYTESILSGNGLKGNKGFGYVDRVDADGLEGYIEFARTLSNTDLKVERQDNAKEYQVLRFLQIDENSRLNSGVEMTEFEPWMKSIEKTLRYREPISSISYVAAGGNQELRFLVLYPVFQELLRGESSAPFDRETIRGWVFAVVSVPDLLEGIDITMFDELEYKVRDSGDGGTEALVEDDLELSGTIRFDQFLEESPLLIEWQSRSNSVATTDTLFKSILAAGLLVIIATTTLFYMLVARFGKTLQDLSIAEHRFELAIDSSQDGIWDYHENTKSCYYSNRMLHMLGVSDSSQSSPEVLLKSLVLKDDRRKFHELMAHCAKSDSPKEIEVQIQHADMEQRQWFSLRAIGSQDPHKKGRRYTGSLSDIHHRKEAEALMESLVERLSNQNAELERFAYVTSHDLQEPLRMVINFSNLVSVKYADLIDQEGQEWLSILVDSAVHMKSLILGILEYASVEHEEGRLSACSINEGAADVRRNLSLLIADTDCVLEVQEDMPAVKVVPLQLYRVLTNIISNSIKYRDLSRPPHITITAMESEQTVFIKIADNGMGMSEEYLDEIFQPFRRLHHRSKISGTGLGLSICRKIVQKYDGTITAESTQGEGSTFTIALPTA